MTSSRRIAAIIYEFVFGYCNSIIIPRTNFPIFALNGSPLPRNRSKSCSLELEALAKICLQEVNMFNWKPHMHSGWQWGRHDGHFLSPRNILLDVALIFAAALIIFTAWKVVPPRIAAAVEFLRPSAQPEAAAQGGALAVQPPNTNLDSNALVEMTYDRSPNYRVDAMIALAERGEIRALPRIQELQVVDGNDNVQQSAYKAEDQFRAHVATELNLPVTEIRYIVATESGDAYAVTGDSLFGQ